MKIVANIILFTLLLFPALGFADTLDGGIVMITNETYARPLSIIGSVIEATPNTGRTVFICFDGQTSNCQSVLANQAVLTLTLCDYVLPIPAPYKDNGYHNVYVWTQALANTGQTQPTTGDLLQRGSPQPFSVISGVLQPRFPPANTVGLGSISPNSVCVVYNTNTAIDYGFSNTFGPWYANARGITNVVAVSIPSPLDGGGEGVGQAIDVPPFNTLLAAINAGCSPTTQWIALAWALPSQVAGDSGGLNSICFAVTNNGYKAPSWYGAGLTYVSFGNNPYFNTANLTPYTIYGIRPTIMVTSGGAGGYGDVTLAEAMVTTAKAGDRTRPTGVADVLYTSDTFRNVRAPGISTVDLGTSISPFVTLSTPAVDYLTSTANILGYFGGEATYTSFGTSTWVAGGFGDSLTSTSGGLPGCSGQTCATWFIDHGAVGSYGSAVEPYNIPQMFVDPSIFLSRYTSGMPLIAAAWGSLQEMWYGANFFGDPLADPYGTNGPVSLSGASISGGGSIK